MANKNKKEATGKKRSRVKVSKLSQSSVALSKVEQKRVKGGAQPTGFVNSIVGDGSVRGVKKSTNITDGTSNTLTFGE